MLLHLTAKSKTSVAYLPTYASVKNFPNEVTVTITPTEKSGLFSDKTKVGYTISVKNGLDDEQKGEISYSVTSDDGESMQDRTFQVSIPGNKKLENTLIIPHERPGQFEIVFNIKLTNFTATYNYTFVYAIGKKPLPPKKTAPVVKVKDVEVVLPEEAPPEEEGEIIVKAIPQNKDGVFKGQKPIVYDIQVRNDYKEAQEGTISYTVKDAVTGKIWREKIYDVKLARKSNNKLKFTIDAPELPGFYNIDLAINTTTYDDTTRYTFGYEVDYISSPYHKPDDFEEFWQNALKELADINPAYQITEDGEKSNEEYKVYRVEMNSLENVRIYGWLSVPKTWIKGKKFPVVALFPGYQVMMKPLFFHDYIALSLNVRGMDKKSAAYPIPDGEEVLTYNIQDKEKYIYRGIYMDCIRGIDFLFANEEMGMDLSRITLLGGSQGAALALVVASLKNKLIKTCIADVPIYCDMHLNLQQEPEIKEEAFTFKYLNNFLAKQAGSFTKEQFLENFSYYEVQNFMPKIKCTVLMAAAFRDALAPPITIFCAFNKLSARVRQTSEIYTFPALGHAIPEVHNIFKNIWMNEKLVKGLKKK